MNRALFFTQWDSFLCKYHLYYRELSEQGKKRFVNRVESIFNNVEIFGKEGLEVNDEIRVLVISNLVQLTFGLKNYWLYGYEYIYLHPEVFFTRKSETPVAGSTYQTKIIELSWHDFARDHLHARDGKNVSLAQYALALLRTVYNGKKFDQKFGSYFDTWFEIIQKECALKGGEVGTQHIYNQVDNSNYVFSKCVEMFFEKPELLKKELPTTFAHLCLLLNQNPLNIENDYQYHPEELDKHNVLVELPKHVPIHFKYNNWHWVYNFSFFGITVCPMVLYFMHDKLLVQTGIILAAILITGLVLGTLPYAYFKQIGLFYNRWLLLLCGIFGYGPCLVISYLFLNQLYGYPFTAQITQHPIANYYTTEHYSNKSVSSAITFNLKDGFLEDFPKARTFEKITQMPNNQRTLFNGIEYEIRHGLLGIPFITKKAFY